MIFKVKKDYKEPLKENETLVINKCKETNYSYGYRSIHGILLKEGYSIGKDTVQRIMQKFNLQCKIKPKRQTKYRGKDSVIANNILNRDFHAERPLEKLVTDITYLPWGERNLYLSSIMNLYDGQIIAYTIGEIQDLEFVIDTLDQLANLEESCNLHSDRGMEFKSALIENLIDTFDISRSLSEAGVPYDNVVAEATFKSIKTEFVYSNKFETLQQLKQELAVYVWWFNNKRYHQTLNYLTPVRYRLENIV